MVRQIALFFLLQLIVINLSTANSTNVINSIFSVLEEKTSPVGNCTANIVILNKKTSLRKVVSIKQGETKISDNLSINLIKCYKEVDSRYRGVMVEIYEHNIDADPHKLFSGWLIYPDQYLSSLQHSIYEILLT